MTLANFRLRYSQFSAISDQLVQLFLDDALLLVGEAWAATADLGQGLYAAHCCALDLEEKAATAGASQAGDIVSKSVGKLSYSRSGEAVVKEMDDWFMRTTFGQRFCYYRDIAGAGAVVSGSSQLDDSGTGVNKPDTISLPQSFDGSNEVV